jgi:hypothetical protein
MQPDTRDRTAPESYATFWEPRPAPVPNPVPEPNADAYSVFADVADGAPAGRT